MSPEARTLFNAVKLAGGSVIGTPQSVSKVRAQSEPASVFFGHQTAMITYSMSDFNSSLCLRACGEEITYNDEDLALNLPAEYKARWRRITSNPVAAAHFSEACMEQLCSILLGFPHDESQQRDGEGIFGTIYYYEFKPETNQRHWLHWHGMITQQEQQTRTLLEALKRPETRETVFRFMKNIQHQMLSDEFYHCFDCAKATESSQQATGEAEPDDHANTDKSPAR